MPTDFENLFMPPPSAIEMSPHGWHATPFIVNEFSTQCQARPLLKLAELWHFKVAYKWNVINN